MGATAGGGGNDEDGEDITVMFGMILLTIPSLNERSTVLLGT